MQCSRIWTNIKVLMLKENMHLNTAHEEECEFAQWQLNIGHGGLTDATNNITLPNFFKCPENTKESLIATIYPTIDSNPLPTNQYFAEHTILTSQNDDIDLLNQKILNKLPGEEYIYHSADTIKQTADEGHPGFLMYPVEYLNSITLYKLTVRDKMLPMIFYSSKIYE